MRRAVTLTLCAATLTACSGAPKRTDPIPTTGLEATRAALAATEVLVDILREQVPDSPEAREAWAGLGASVEAGEALCDAWEEAGEAPSSWRDWVTRALTFVEGITTALVGAGVAVPSYVGVAVGALKLLLPLISAAIGA